MYKFKYFNSLHNTAVHVVEAFVPFDRGVFRECVLIQPFRLSQLISSKLITRLQFLLHSNLYFLVHLFSTHIIIINHSIHQSPLIMSSWLVLWSNSNQRHWTIMSFKPLWVIDNSSYIYSNIYSCFFLLWCFQLQEKFIFLCRLSCSVQLEWNSCYISGLFC